MAISADTYENGYLLQPGTLFAALCDTGEVGKFHWLLYLCISRRTGYKYHATNQMGSIPWKYEYGPWDGPQSQRCITLTPIGKVEDWGARTPHACAEELHSILRNVPLITPPVDQSTHDRFTCRTWFRAAIRRLDGMQKYVQCPDVDLLEEKLAKMATAAELMNARDNAVAHPPTRIMKPTEFAAAWD
ncbi:hypothetical protein K466DRAFT_204947 [Polyporus arcularius HHB13444]|uniref:Uncharacterized protein n=2 Tax=Polyporaceae TaxID=5317 RepID=A0A5C3P5P1_9APHY|nr:hypothetical protein OH76DRAFT_1400367 [Polyporus brumalis]TFK84995.1 hypothetical protein K466DRAFT_204947 [Polyporus arcularius HHB13444]